MKEEKITIRTTDPDGTSAEISALCTSITWDGDSRSISRTLSFSPVVSEIDKGLPRAPTELGGSVQLRMGNNLLMDAYTLERTRDSLGHSIDTVAYDRGIYLKRNSKYMRVEGQTPEAVTESLCGEFGIQTGTIASTGIPITQNFLGVNLYKIIMTLYSLAADRTGKKYALRFRGAALEVVEMAQSLETILLRPGSNLLNCTTKESVSQMTNSVALYDENFQKLSTEEDSEAIRLYGLMQAAIKASSYDDPTAHAKKLLKENGMQTTITLNALGNPKLITGNTVAIQEPITDTYGLFWITSDTHTWKKGIYQTKISVSLEALMDRQTAGSLPSE